MVWAWIWMCVVWISGCSAIGYGIHITHSAHCLWALLILGMIGFTATPSKKCCKGCPSKDCND